MNELGRITRMSAADGVNAHARALGGDASALRRWVLWSAWRRINAEKGTSKAKVEAFDFIRRSTVVSVAAHV